MRPDGGHEGERHVVDRHEHVCALSGLGGIDILRHEGLPFSPGLISSGGRGFAIEAADSASLVIIHIVRGCVVEMAAQCVGLYNAPCQTMTLDKPVAPWIPEVTAPESSEAKLDR